LYNHRLQLGGHYRFFRGALMISEARFMAGALLVLLLAGCANQAPMSPPSVTLEIGGDVFPMNPTPTPPQPGAALAEPPLNLAVPAGPLPVPGVVSAAPQNGQYAGSGTATHDPLGECKSPIQIQNWFVSGSNVSFGAFQGTIGVDGSLAMQVRNTYISGRFAGSRFEGRVWQGVGVGCQYLISLYPNA
jgi:hypothetical protein